MDRYAPISLNADVELLERIENTLYTAVVADSLDELGYHDCAMSEKLRPVVAKHCFAGWARTISCRDVHYELTEPYAKEIEAVDSLLPGEVAVVSTQQSRRNAPWGELLSTAAKARGARGAVVDGLVRDVKKIENLGFGVFASGIKPVDSSGRGVAVEYNVPIECGEIIVSPGDLVFADYDGVVVVPKAIVAEVIRLATSKVSKEDRSRADLANGVYLRDVYKTYGVL